MDLTKPPNPVRIILDTTRRCQLSCWYCHSSSGPDYRGAVLDPAAIPAILDAADRLRAFDITITGGEPTLWPGLVPLLGSSHQLRFASLQLITNGLATSPRVLRAIESSALTRICVSLDGVSDVHDTNRGAGNFKRTVHGIKQLRTVHDNLTVISVIDATNHTRWPELTRALADLGVSQHHLAPVCFAGHAMRDYRGLSEQQFEQIRATVGTIASELPTGFTLRFNDTLIRAPRTRTMSLHQMTETWKGWHVIVRPDGDVRTAVRAWGRSWRTDETVGSVCTAPLAEVLESRRGIAAPFTRTEEVARKFHLGATAPLILTDIHDVATTEHGRPAPHSREGGAPSVPAPAADLGADLAALAKRIRQNPCRYRLREEEGFALLFNTHNHDVHLLDNTEFSCLSADLVEVSS
ncbi:MAG: radical SAM protein [Pseudonocardiaceae bacterium]